VMTPTRIMLFSMATEFMGHGSRKRSNRRHY
jgi:hypothetical protein